LREGGRERRERERERDVLLIHLLIPLLFLVVINSKCSKCICNLFIYVGCLFIYYKGKMRVNLM